MKPLPVFNEMRFDEPTRLEIAKLHEAAYRDLENAKAEKIAELNTRRNSVEAMAAYLDAMSPITQAMISFPELRAHHIGTLH